MTGKSSDSSYGSAGYGSSSGGYGTSSSGYGTSSSGYGKDKSDGSTGSYGALGSSYGSGGQTGSYGYQSGSSWSQGGGGSGYGSQSGNQSDGYSGQRGSYGGSSGGWSDRGGRSDRGRGGYSDRGRGGDGGGFRGGYDRGGDRGWRGRGGGFGDRGGFGGRGRGGFGSRDGDDEDKDEGGFDSSTRGRGGFGGRGRGMNRGGRGGMDRNMDNPEPRKGGGVDWEKTPAVRKPFPEIKEPPPPPPPSDKPWVNFSGSGGKGGSDMQTTAQKRKFDGGSRFPSKRPEPLMLPPKPKKPKEEEVDLTPYIEAHLQQFCTEMKDEEKKRAEESLKPLMKSTFCVLCNAKITAPAQAATHYQGKNHLKKVKTFVQSGGEMAPKPKQEEKPEKDPKEMTPEELKAYEAKQVTLDQKVAEVCRLLILSSCLSLSTCSGFKRETYFWHKWKEKSRRKAKKQYHKHRSGNFKRTHKIFFTFFQNFKILMSSIGFEIVSTFYFMKVDEEAN